MRRGITIIAFLFFMIAVSVFVVIMNGLSNDIHRSGNQTVTVTTTIATEESAQTTLADNRIGAVTTTVLSFPMDINDAGRDALATVPGIGDTLADSIISYRHSVGTISDMDMLLEINGIGEAKLAALKEYFYVSDIYTVTTAATTTATTATTIRTANATTSATTTVIPTVTAAVRSVVSINSADADELMRCLLITIAQAEEIVSLREEIGGYVNTLEILYCESISDSLYLDLKEYLTL